MPIPLPNLDDRSYEELVSEAIAMIPMVQPEWTNHNPTDPGVVLIELLAWLTEMMLYQVNEVSSSHIGAFLELLNGPDWQMHGNQETAVRETIVKLRERYRAVTPDDFNDLIFNIWPTTEAAKSLGEAGAIARICCLSQMNLESATPLAAAPAHVSLVILPQRNANSNTSTEPTAELLQRLAAFLEPRLLLSTIHHVVKPAYVTITVQGRIYVRDDVPLADALDIIDGPEVGLVNFFDPHVGGPEGDGWPFGRGVYASEIYAILSRLSVVDYVDAVQIIGPDNQPNEIGVDIAPHQLVNIDLSQLLLVDIYGNEINVS